MNINIIAVGSLKEKFWKDAVSEYKKRLSRYCRLEISEVKDEKTPEEASEKAEDLIRETEGKRILGIFERNRADSFVVSLDMRGKMLSSEEFSKTLEQWETRSRGNLSFVIGGSLGLSKEVLSRSDYVLSFSKLTFPHQLMRVVLLEQIYRAYRIMRHEPYHK